MATIKKACKGVSYPKSSSVSSRLGSPGKAKSGTSLGMKSVKAGFDKNPGVTRADIIVAGKGQAKKGMKVKKAQTGYEISKGSKMEGLQKSAKELKEKASNPYGITKGSKLEKIKQSVKQVKMKSGGKMSKCKYGCK